jgi:hypothetical protein
MTITTRAGKGSALTHVELDANITELDGRTASGWSDMLAPLVTAGVPVQNAPSLTGFAGTSIRKEYAFALNDYCYVIPFHVNHDVKPNSLAHLHVHWTTNGTSTATVKWELSVIRALGHNQQAFTTPTVITIEQAASGTAWRHMIAEDQTGITLYEPDELIMVTLKRITNGGTNNTDTVFGLMCDIHYQVDRLSTPNKVPNFYG